MRGARGWTRAMRDGGFTLLELLLAIALFSLVVVFTLQITSDTTDKVLAGIRARELRFLAERKLGEVLIFEQEYDRFEYDSGDLGDYAEEYADWKWELSIRTVIVFGESTDEEATYLFGEPDTEDEEETSTTAAGGEAEKEGETQELRELILRVTAPSDGEATDFVEIITFMPEIDRG